MPSDAPQQETVLEYPLDAPILVPSSWHPALLQVALQRCPVFEDLEGPAVQLVSTDLYWHMGFPQATNSSVRGDPVDIRSGSVP